MQKKQLRSMDQLNISYESIESIERISKKLSLSRFEAYILWLKLNHGGVEKISERIGISKKSIQKLLAKLK